MKFIKLKTGEANNEWLCNLVKGYVSNFSDTAI